MSAFAQADSTLYAKFDSLLEQYYSALLLEDTQTKCAEVDFLVDSCKDSLLRQHIACGIFKHYLDSPLMGEEEVSLHVYDRWFAPGIVVFPTDEQDFEAQLFATFERQSMLYMQGQGLELYGPDSEDVLFPGDTFLQVIVFYDTSCTKCKALFSLLPASLESFFEAREMPLDTALELYLVYTGTSEEQWKGFRDSFKCFAPQVKTVHAWDPEMESGYQLKYGVTTTPRMLLLTPGGMIIGRRLETDSLLELMNYYYLYERNAKEEE